ncbi:recombinase family protein [Gymnodinialimonas sp.]
MSTAEQIVARQLLQLEAHCDELRIEYVSAVAASRPVFELLMNDLRKGDTLVVLDVDRAFRSAIDALSVVQTLRDLGISFDIINLPVDVQSDLGEFLYGSIALFAQLERKIIRRRTREGLAAARQRGVRLGRPATLNDTTIRDAHQWMRSDEIPCRYVAALLGVSRLTLQRGFHRLGLEYPIKPKEREAA